MKDILGKLTDIEASAPKNTKRMLKEDSTTPPANVSNKPATLKDMFESIAGMKPIPVVGKEGGTQQTGAGFVNVTDPSLQGLGKTLGDLAAQKKVQIVVPTQPGQQPTGTQPTGTTQPAPAGATGQPQPGQQLMREVDSPVKARYNVKPTKYSSTGKFMVRDLKDHCAVGVYQTEEEALAAAEKLNKEREQRLMRGRNDDRAPTNEGAKVDRMVKHIEKSERKLGKSKDKAEDIAWATANKRGYLDNKSKKKTNESSETEYRVLGQYDAKTSKGYDTRPVSVKVKAASEKEAKELAKEKLAHNHKNYRATKVETLSNKVEEADIPSSQGVDTRGAGLGAGRSATTLESKSISKAVDNSEKQRQNLIKKAARELNSKTRPTTAEQLVKKYDLFPKDAAAIKKMAKELSKVEESNKPDFLDLDKDGNKKESMKKAAADKKKQKVKESMNHRISAARLEGKSHGLKGHAHCGKNFEDLEERKAYCEGYKDGLDECYGQGVYEDAMPATVPGMADAAMDEGNAFTAALARTPKGGKFSVGGRSFTDNSSLDEYAFESLDRQLNALLNEGLSVSVSKGNQGAPDSVNINATDSEADQLLDLVKHAGLGLFGDDQHEPSSAMSVQPSHGEPNEIGAGAVDIDVVDGSDGMLSLMKKLSGVEDSGSEDYADEEEYGYEDDGEDEHTCNECGMMEAECHCDKEKIEEVETEDQMEFEVSEETDAQADEEAEAEEDAALAGADSGNDEEVTESFFDLLGKLNTLSEAKEDTEEEDEKAEKAGKKVTKDIEYDDKKDKKEKVDEWANQTGKGPGKGTEASFEEDIDFMTKVIAGGLNKPKSTGQTTVPVIAGQDERMHDHQGPVSDTVDDWKKLAGIK